MAGRKRDPNPLIGNVRIAPEDLEALTHLEARTALTPDELIRLLVHLAIWESGDMVPDFLRTALEEARRLAKPEE